MDEFSAEIDVFASLDVLAAALDSGLAVSILFIFFTLQYPKNGTVRSCPSCHWWYTQAVFEHLDWREQHSYLVGVRISSMGLYEDAMK